MWKFSIPFLDRAELQDDGADGLLLDALGFGLSSSRHDLLLAFDPDPLKIPLRLECQLLCRLFRFNGFVEAFGKLKVGNVQLIEENETVDQTGLHGGLDLVLHHLPLRDELLGRELCSHAFHDFLNRWVNNPLLVIQADLLVDFVHFVRHEVIVHDDLGRHRLEVFGSRGRARV